MEYNIGIDCGGSKSNLIACDDKWDIIWSAKFRGEGCSEDDDACLLPYLSGAIGALCNSCHITTLDRVNVCVNLGGKNVKQVHNTLASAFPAAAIEVYRESEGEIPLKLANMHGCSLALLAGTGSIAIGQNKINGNKYVCGGWGQWLGDEGSGFWIGMEAIRAALRSVEGSGHQTVLVHDILKYHNVFPSGKELKTIMKERDIVRDAVCNLSRKEIAGFVPVVAANAANGDETSRLILYRAGQELARITETVIIKTLQQNQDVRILATGGLANIWDMLKDGFEDYLNKKLLKWDLVLSKRTLAEASIEKLKEKNVCEELSI